MSKFGPRANSTLSCLCGRCTTCKHREYTRRRVARERAKRLGIASFQTAQNVENVRHANAMRAEAMWQERRFEEWADKRREVWAEQNETLRVAFARTVERIRVIETQQLQAFIASER